MSEIRVRIAPSPTGVPHIGNTRTALYNFLFAKHNSGKFFVRIEDTDRERLVPESLNKIMEIFAWLGLKHDNEPLYVQSEHLENYKKAALQLVEKGAAYYCFCTKERLEKLRAEQNANHQISKYDKHCLKLTKSEVEEKLKKGEKYVIRLNVPKDKNLEWVDLIRGHISVNSKEVDDQVLLKSDGFPTYHLAVVFDDNMMGITHVLRGAEWISSTPKHILLYEALGYEKPFWGHLPLILGADRSKLSKRHGAQSALDYRDQGYLPEALLNTMLFWGWSPKDNKQFYNLTEMIRDFDISGVNKNDPIVDLQKFDHFNAFYIRQMTNEKLLEMVYGYMTEEQKKGPQDKLIAVMALIKDRMKKLSDWRTLSDNFFQSPDGKKVRENLFSLKIQSTNEIVKKIFEILSSEISWKDNQTWQAVLRKIADDFKIKSGDVFMILRILIWGDKITPPIYETMKVIGTEESLKRIKSAVDSR